MRLGIISDTHGLWDPQVADVFAGVARILHAGDIGSLEVLEALEAIAPVTAVRGNVDVEAWCERLPESACLEVGGHRLWMTHVGGFPPKVPEALEKNLREAAANAAIFGHSHEPRVENQGGVLYLNPGSAGPQRFHLPRAVALMEVGEQISARIVLL
ncbi:MAG: metallophosphoesterase family protein [Planctomycetes bacterium]|nr:metallophosphoesterase family protein [Planctomycetota bacterium]